MDHPVEVLDQVVRDLDRVLCAGTVSSTIAGLSDAEKMDFLRAAGDVARRAEALIVEVAAVVPARPAGSGDLAFCGQFGCRTMSELLQRVLRTDSAGAGRIVKAARLVRRDVDFSSGAWLPALWPELRVALATAAIGITGLLAATSPIEQSRGRIGAEARLRADAELAAATRGWVLAESDTEAGSSAGSCADAAPDAGSCADAAPMATPEDLRILAQRIAMHLDPDGAAPAEEIAMRGRGVILGRARNGLIPIRGELLPEVAGQLRRMWDAQLSPRVEAPPVPGVHFVPSDILPDDDVGGMIDTRSRAQTQHDALAALLGTAARHDEMPRLGGAAPTLIVSVAAEDYATGRGWAQIEGVDVPVSLAVARHTACGGTVQRVLFDPDGRIVGLGSTDRIFTAHQRRAITLRDQECLIPGCHVPASWCEIHHVQEHAQGGPTHTDNGVALCWHHHRTLETSGWEFRMDNGVPRVRGPGWWDPARRWRAPRPTAVVASRPGSRTGRDAWRTTVST